jgi:hypothetical protein
MAKSASRKTAKKATKTTTKKTAKASAAKKRVRVAYSAADVKELRAHSKAKTPLKVISKTMKRTEGSLRQKAMALGIRLGHRR